MRLCRFRCDDLVLTGFFADNVVIPLDQAAEAYSRDTGVELLLPSTEDLLELLPPDGSSFAMARDLNAWVADLDVFARDELTVPVADVQILVPIARPSKLLLLAGNYAIPYAAMSETSLNCWKLSVIRVFSCSAWLVGRLAMVPSMAA